MATAKDLVDLLLTQDGDPYIFGVEVSPSASNPRAFDCSELIEWGCALLGVNPVMPDGAIYQIRHCQKHNLLIPVNEAMHTCGTLLFSFSGDPFNGGRPAHAHVALSQGNGKTIEARGKAYGVGAFSAQNRGWTHAALIPGLEYCRIEMSSATGKTYRVTAENELHYRSGPGTEYEVWGKLAHGEEVIVPDTDGWLPILLDDDTTAWVSKKFVEEVPESSSSQEVPKPGPEPGPSSVVLFPDQLQEIIPSLSNEKVVSLIPALNLAMNEAKINTPLRQAAFIAQVAHESQGFSAFVENLNYRADRLLEVFGKYFTEDEALEYARQPERIANRVYANRLGNGNEDSGDGWRYRGRGFIQITGKDNYREAGKFLNQDLVSKPELAENMDIGARIAAWYWTKCDLNSYIDRCQFDTITKKINGGLNGYKDRLAYYTKAKEVLGA